MQLTGKTVLIPGASRPLGRQIARRFAREGAQLVLPWFDWPESVAEMTEEFSDMGKQVLMDQCDLRSISATQQLAKKIKGRFEAIDILINNIERGGMPVVHGSYHHEHNSEQWQLEMETTLKAKWNLYQASLPLLRRSGRGSIVNISSIAGHIGRSGPAASFFSDGYSAANRAIQSLTENWAREAAPEVRVNEIMLGLVHDRHGENTRGWSSMTKTERDDIIAHTPLGRLGSPEEVADLVYFVAVEATYMTGSVVRMDGGYLLGGEVVPPVPPGIL